MARLSQEKLLEIFNAIKPEMKFFETGSIKAMIDIEGKYDLWSIKNLVIDNRKRDGIGFATIIVQSNYVGFYFMPVYCQPPHVLSKYPPDLLKLLKGKACFHIKEINPQLLVDIKYALQIGYECFQRNGWID